MTTEGTAVRPRVGDRRSGQTPRRRQSQGNADQERECAPREGTLTKRGNAHQEREQGTGNRERKT